MTVSPPLLRVEHATMRFGHVTALEDASLTVDSGEVICLLGDNGAGKSTLIRILSGVYRPTAGRYWIDGQAVNLQSPRQALAHGIATVHQDLALLPLMSIWRNFFLGSELVHGRGPLRRLDVARCRTIARTSLASLGITVRDPDQPVGTLSGGERQGIAIARAIHLGARVLILDEPTAALGVKQADVVLQFISNARARDIAILFVTHNPLHAYAVGDRFVVLRQGRVEYEGTRSDVTIEELTARMTGK